ncbi:hypothetical protein DB44_BY00380 [Candidatus Protochlamydia amoebophila]|uniref:Uncharacterized protein n=1 Tax=Candidatus Protochlamydia amoebophila TaxID=362787 RepID=A0A0C1JNU8_9BACT|nr:hypothetical protein DB44_BY00380 [Candidatus Protochlamydia amoebophila]
MVDSIKIGYAEKNFNTNLRFKGFKSSKNQATKIVYRINKKIKPLFLKNPS